MGNIHFWMSPDLAPPDPVFVPKYDPMLGFPNGRKERVIKTTFEEMEAAAVPPELRDYCIDDYMKFLKCRAEVFPFNYKCAHEAHQYKICEFNDHELRMKEYERERRLDKKLEENLQD